jgi:hypothetical protein
VLPRGPLRAHFVKVHYSNNDDYNFQFTKSTAN